MSNTEAASIHPLPRSAPAPHAPRLLLYAIRRMGAHGLRDAHAANALLGAFGLPYRRPLVLIRALLLELARSAKGRIIIAGCCCPRITSDEAWLIEAVSVSTSDPVAARNLLAQCLGTEDCLGALLTAQAVDQAFRDLGRPLD
jgi:hypothetical protein